jgi:hypothetical protein
MGQCYLNTAIMIWQLTDIWSHASYRYTILWVAFLDPSESYFLFADLVGFYRHWTYIHIFRHIVLSNYWWQKSDIWSHASYRYPVSGVIITIKLLIQNFWWQYLTIEKCWWIWYLKPNYKAIIMTFQCTIIENEKCCRTHFYQ